MRKNANGLTMLISNMLMTIYAVISTPCHILNKVAWIVAIIWLLFQKEWGLLVIGGILSTLGIFIISFLVMPGILISCGLFKLTEKWGESFSWTGLIGMFLSMAVVAVVWGVGIFYYFEHVSRPESLYPTLLWACFVAVNPWQIMAAKEKNPSSALLTSLYQVSCTGLMVVAAIYPLTLIGSTVVLSVFIVALIVWLGLIGLTLRGCGKDLFEELRIRGLLRQLSRNPEPIALLSAQGQGELTPPVSDESSSL